MSYRNNQPILNFNSSGEKSKVRVTKLQEDIDDLHVTIQSSIPIRSDKQKYHYSKSNLQYERSNYYIQIDDQDFTDIDLTVKVGNQAYTTQIRTKPSNPAGQYQSRPIQSQALSYRNRNKHSGLENGQQNNSIAANYASQPVQSQRTVHSKTQPHINVHKTQENRSLIKIVDGHLQSQQSASHFQVSKWHTPCLNSKHKQMWQYQQRTNHIKQFKKQRGEKSFGDLRSETKLQGRIIKNQQNIEKNYEYIKRRQNLNEVGKADQGHRPGQSKISYFQKNKNNSINIQAEQIQEHLLTPSNRTPKSQKPKIAEFTTQQKTPSRNYLTRHQQSPVIYPYKDHLSSDEEFSPVFPNQQSNEWKRPKIFKKNPQIYQNDVFNDEEFQNQRNPPLPYTNKNQINLNIPSFKQIPYQSKKQQVPYFQKKQTQTIKIEQIRKGEPIIIPFSKVAKDQLNKKGVNANEVSQQRNKSDNQTLYKQRYQTQYHDKQQPDFFRINKRRYLDKLKMRDKSKSNLTSVNRTFSNSRRHSLSPECQLVTNRLYKSKINKQPCPRYLHYQQMMKRIQMKKTLGQYTFIRRYLSDTEIYRILADMQQQGIPEKKWPIRLVDIVYDKLRALKNN